MLDILLIGVLVGLLITAIAILTALKSGFNEIIRGLEAVSEALDRLSSKTDR